VKLLGRRFLGHRNSLPIVNQSHDFPMHREMQPQSIQPLPMILQN
jgi:hypothetical protein